MSEIKFRNVIGLAALALFLSPIPKATGLVFGFDNRIEIKSTASPWRSIGLLVRGVRRENGTFGALSHCTATLISESLILTAAHCVGKTDRVHEFRFAANFAAGERSEAETWSEAKLLVSGEAQNTGDWAILSLAIPLGKRFGYIPVMKFDFTERLPLPDTSFFSKKFFQKNPFEVQPVTVVGYPTKLTLHAHVNCTQLVAAENSMIRYGGQVVSGYCDLTPGQSGGPVLLQVDGQLKIVAIISSRQVGLQFGSDDRNWIPIDNSSINNFMGLYFVADQIQKFALRTSN